MRGVSRMSTNATVLSCSVAQRLSNSPIVKVQMGKAFPVVTGVLFLCSGILLAFSASAFAEHSRAGQEGHSVAEVSNGIERIYGRWVVDPKEECYTDYDEYKPGFRTVVSFEDRVNETSPVRIEQKGNNVIVHINGNTYTEYEFVSENQMRSVMSVRNGEIKRKYSDKPGGILVRCDPAVVAAGKQPAFPNASRSTSSNPSTSAAQSSYLARFTCKVSGQTMPVNQCFYEGIKYAPGRLRIRNRGTVEAYTDVDFINKMQGMKYEVSLSGEFEIQAQANGDSYSRLQLEIMDKDGKVVFQDQATRGSIIRVKP